MPNTKIAGTTLSFSIILHKCNLHVNELLYLTNEAKTQLDFQNYQKIYVLHGQKNKDISNKPFHSVV